MMMACTMNGRLFAISLWLWSSLLPAAVEAEKSKLLRRRAKLMSDNRYLPLNEFVLDLDRLIVDDNEGRMLETSLSMSFGLTAPPTLEGDANLEGQEGESGRLDGDEVGGEAGRVDGDTNDSNAPTFSNVTNGDEVKYGPQSQFPYIGNFHKTLPHSSNGIVDVDAYQMLVNDCIESVNATACSQVPGGTSKLANPLGGHYYPAQGSLPSALVLPPPPAVDSAELAFMYAEVGWMALLRDVPFSQYDNNELVQEAVASLSEFVARPDIDNQRWKRPINQNGTIDPMTQLFRLDLPGVTNGPMVSQFLLETFEIDGIVVEPKITTIVPDSDTMTTFDEFLCVQNGGTDCFDAPARDPIPRYLRNARDLGFVAQNDKITSIYTRAANIDGMLQPDISFYHDLDRHKGFSTQGEARILEQIVAAAAGVSPAWFTKWNVHRAVRPEAYGGLVDQRISPNGTDFPVHSSLLDNVVIEKMVAKWGSALLPQMNDVGCPNHPSYPAGHAMVAGACVTVLKAYMDPDATRCYPSPIKQASPDGLSLETVIAQNDGPNCITVTGELHKLAHNIALGRDMSGLHFRSDGVGGIRQGEEYAISFLQDDLDRQPECAKLRFQRFDGDFMEIWPRRSECQ